MAVKPTQPAYWLPHTVTKMHLHHKRALSQQSRWGRAVMNLEAVALIQAGRAIHSLEASDPPIHRTLAEPTVVRRGHWSVSLSSGRHPCPGSAEPGRVSCSPRSGFLSSHAYPSHLPLQICRGLLLQGDPSPHSRLTGVSASCVSRSLGTPVWIFPISTHTCFQGTLLWPTRPWVCNSTTQIPSYLLFTWLL